MVVWRIVGVLVLIGLLEIGHAYIEILPTSRSVGSALLELATTGAFWSNLGTSLARVIVGLATAVAIAFSLAFLSYLSGLARNLIEGMLGILRPIPPIAWIPLSIAIFGLSNVSSIFVIVIGAFFPIFSSSTQALTFEGRAALGVAIMLQGPSLRHFTQVVIPASLPTIFTGMRVAIGFAWMVVVVAEMIAVKSGLGYQIQIERQLLRLDYVIAYMAVIGLVGALLSVLAELVQRWVMPYLRRSEEMPQENDREISEGLVEGGAPLIDLGSAIQVRGITCSFASGPAVLSGLNLHIAAGELIAIVGGSGSGKTTLLRILSGELTPDEGRIIVDGGVQDDQPPGWVFQSEGLFNWMTVRENIEFGIPRDRVKQHYPLQGWLKLAGIAELANRYPGSLSGGQRQRVQVVRALVSRRELVLMDEPFSALDAIAREAMVPAIRHVFKQAGRTCVLVTHDLRDAIKFSDRICVLADGHIVGDVAIGRPVQSSEAADSDMTNRLIAQHFDPLWKMLDRSTAIACQGKD